MNFESITEELISSKVEEDEENPEEGDQEEPLRSRRARGVKINYNETDSSPNKTRQKKVRQQIIDEEDEDEVYETSAPKLQLEQFAYMKTRK